MELLRPYFVTVGHIWQDTSSQLFIIKIDNLIKIIVICNIH